MRVQGPASRSERDSYAKVLEAGCTKGAVNACAGALVVRGGAKTATIGGLRKLCETTANSHACSLMGDLDALDKDSLPAKVKEQRALMQRSCDAQPGPACFILAQLEVEGSNGTKIEADVSHCLIAPAPAGMARPASNWDRLTWSRSIPNAPARPTSEAARCSGLRLVTTSAGWRKRRPAAVYATLAKRACGLGDATACDDRAAAASAGGDKDANARYCALWGANACYEELGRITHEGGETAEQAERIVELALTACRRGHRGACRTLQHAFQDWTRGCASSAAKQRCDDCALAWFAAMQADAIPAGLRDALKLERGKAKEQLNASCAAGAQVSCQAAAKLRD